MDTPTARISIAPLLAVNFVGTLGFSIVTPFLVVLVTDWGGNAVVYGVLAAAYSFFQLIGAPLLGRMSDRVGRRRVLLLSQLGTLLSWAIFLVAFVLPTAPLAQVTSDAVGEFAITLPLLVLLLARSFDGLTGGNVSVSNAYLADITPQAERSRNFGRMAVSSNIGFIIGPALGGLLGATLFGALLPVLAAFAISAAALALIQFTLVDIRPKPVTESLEAPSACDLFGQEQKPGYRLACEKPRGVFEIFGLPGMKPLMAVNFLVMLGFSFFYAAFPVHAVTGLGWTAASIGIYFAVLSLFMVVVQGPVLSWASDHVGERVLLVGGGLALAAGFAAYRLGDGTAAYAAAVLIALGNGLMWPTFMARLAEAAGTRLQGAVQGYASSAGAVASIAGLIGGGVLYVFIGPDLFPAAAGVIALAAVMALGIPQGGRPDQAKPA